MAQAVISVRIRDKDYRLIGEATNYISLTATIRFNEVGEWSMDVPGEAPEVKLLLLSENPAGGIVIYRDDRLFFSGPIWRTPGRWMRPPATRSSRSPAAATTWCSPSASSTPTPNSGRA